MLDRTISGVALRISPEAPVPVVEPDAWDACGGGAANLARNLVALGAEVAVAGIVGDDPAGEELVALIHASGGGTSGVIRAAGHRTTVKLRITADGRHLLRLDDEVRAEVDADDWARMIGGLAADLPDVDAVVISDYDKGVVGAGLVGALREAAPQATMFADPKGADLERYRGVDLVSPNLEEVEPATGMPVAGDDALVRAVKSLQRALPATDVLVTRGAAGLSLFATDGSVHHSATRPQRAFDVSGAGDTALAAVVVARCLGSSWPQAMDVANVAAGIAVSQVGTSTVCASEVRAVMRRRATESGDHAPIVSRDHLLRLATIWRADGLRVVFTNGCFDLLHAGHVDVLCAAKELGDILVVALNDDASVKRLKGTDHPIVDLPARAAILAALRPVDVVTAFAEDTPLETILALRPDVLVKGSDYQASGVVGSTEAAGWGGDTVVIPLTAGRASTALRDRLPSIRGSERDLTELEESPGWWPR